MNRTIDMSVIFAAALSFAACGPKAEIGDGQQGAAEALYAAGTPAISSTASNAASPLTINFTGDTSVACRFGGSADFKDFGLATDTGGTGFSSGAKFTLSYDNCGIVRSSAGTAIFNGSFDVTQSIVTTNSTVTLAQTFKGKVTVGGAFDDFLQADVTQNLDVSGVNATDGARVSESLVGTVADDSGSFTFNNRVSVTAGNLSVQVTKQ